MDALNTFNVAAGVASILGLAYAYGVARKNAREKQLVFDLSHPVAIASVVRDAPGQRISVLYQKENDVPQEVNGAYVLFVRVANVGRDPIMRSHVHEHDPVRLEIRGSRLLDISIESVHREVSELTLGDRIYTAEGVTVPLDFTLLDYQDGCLLRLILEGPAKVTLKGTIAGMPQGIVSLYAISSNRMIGKITFAAMVIIGAGALLAVPFLYRWIAGSWRGAWLLLLPIAALVVAILLMGLVDSLLMGMFGVSISPKLAFPDWLHWTRMEDRFLPPEGFSMTYRPRRSAPPPKPTD